MVSPDVEDDECCDDVLDMQIERGWRSRYEEARKNPRGWFRGGRARGRYVPQGKDFDDRHAHHELPISQVTSCDKA